VFGFTGTGVAIEFGNYTDNGVLVAYRIDGQDWLFSNVTGGRTYQFVNPASPGVNLTQPANATQRFELRVTNWALYVFYVFSALQALIAKAEGFRSSRFMFLRPEPYMEFQTTRSVSR